MTNELQKKYEDVIDKCREDEAYKKAFLAKPADTLKEAGIPLEENVTYHVMEETKGTWYIVLPAEDPKAVLKEVFDHLLQESEPAAGLLAHGYEVRIIRDTEKEKHLILPVSTKELSEAELHLISGGADRHVFTSRNNLHPNMRWRWFR